MAIDISDVLTCVCVCVRIIVMATTIVWTNERTTDRPTNLPSIWRQTHCHHKGFMTLMIIIKTGSVWLVISFICLLFLLQSLSRLFLFTLFLVAVASCHYMAPVEEMPFVLFFRYESDSENERELNCQTFINSDAFDDCEKDIFKYWYAEEKSSELEFLSTFNCK